MMVEDFAKVAYDARVALAMARVADRFQANWGGKVSTRLYKLNEAIEWYLVAARRIQDLLAERMTNERAFNAYLGKLQNLTSEAHRAYYQYTVAKNRSVRSDALLERALTVLDVLHRLIKFLETQGEVIAFRLIWKEGGHDD